MATIEQRGESVRVNWRFGGSREGARQSCTFRGAPAARTKLAHAAKQLVESRNHDMTRDECYTAVLGKTATTTPSVPTLKQWVDTWLDDRARTKEIQADVVVSYRRILGLRAIPYLGHMRLTDIDQDVLRGWVAWMTSSRVTVGGKSRRDGRLLAAATVRRTHAILHACLGAAVPRWIPANPAARPAGARFQTGLPKPEQFESMYLSPDEIQLVLDRCSPHIRDLVYVAVHTGMRLGELVALECRNVVFSTTGATILVRSALKNDGTVGAPKSVRSRRDVTVGRKVADVLAARVMARKPRSLVFPTPRGGMWDPHNLRDRYWYRAVASAMRCEDHPPPLPPKPMRGPRRQWTVDEVSECRCSTRLHRRPRLHDLRHTHASLLIAERWHTKKIQVRLGHASYQTTMNVYGHLMDLGDEGELHGIEQLLEPPPPPATARGRRPTVRSSARRVRCVVVPPRPAR